MPCSCIRASTAAGGGAAAVIISTDWGNSRRSAAVAFTTICMTIGAPQKWVKPCSAMTS